ncbi:MAG: hypothetical protein JXR49_04195 [Acidobacteria bacterium]|nr:hypothetical protein [Acidobacteriota bacterium]
MTGFRYFLVLGMFAAIVAAFPGPSGALSAQDTSEIQYEVFSPWAEVDPIPLRGISPRIDSLAGKKIGVFANYKRAALPIAGSLQKRLNALYPDSEISLFHSSEWNVTEIETEDRDKFEAWVKGVDAVILVVGD